jgi:hypothetical protein
MNLRRQHHEAALNFAHRKIEAKQEMLDDVQIMMTKVEEEDLLVGYHKSQNMWKMLDDIVWKIVDDIEVVQNVIDHVLKQNKNRDENEAWEEYGFCGMPIIGQRN